MCINNIYDIKRESIIELFSSIIFLRGEEYYEEGLVNSIEPVSSTTITGTVEGNQEYIVSISLDEEGYILCHCTCPCDFNCKHAAAVLLKWLSIKNQSGKKLEKTKPDKTKSLEDMLNKKSKEELVFLLKTFVGNHPELKAYVYINKNELIFKIKNLFSRFWDWHEVKNLIFQLDTILQGINTNKTQWDMYLLEEMNKCSEIMIDNIENIHDDGELSMFLDDWFQTYGKIFSTIKSTASQKEEFIKNICQLMQEDDYGLEYSYQQALLGMCTSKKDIDLIIKHLKLLDSNYDNFGDYHTEFVLQLYDKIGMHDIYIDVALKSKMTTKAIDKLIQLKRYQEALQLCKNKDDSLIELEIRRADILKKLGQTQQWQKSLMTLLKKTGYYNYSIQLKQGSTKKEWLEYRQEIINFFRNKGRDDFLSRLYYDEGDYKKAYEYAHGLTDENYLELLAKKLSKNHPELACNILKKLCFSYVLKGSGWPYKKAGLMLKEIKKVDNNGNFFKTTKQQLIYKHKKKYSLMDIIEKI